MWSSVQMRTKIVTGLAILATTLLAVGLIGVQGISRLGDDLQYIVGPAWSTADGAMETTIQIEAQMILVDRILDSRDGTQYLAAVNEARTAAREALERVANAGIIPEQQVRPVTELYQRYGAAREKLLADHQTFTSVRQKYEANTEKFVRLGRLVEEIGDGAVEEIERDPEAPFSWNQGLKDRWTAADGGMESNIGMLWQLYYLEQLLAGGDSARLEGELAKAVQFQEEAASGMFATGRFNESAGADFANQTYAQAYEGLLSSQKQLMADLISAYKAFQASREGYQATANALRQSLVEIEKSGDQAVEGKTSEIEVVQSRAESLMEISLGVGLVLAAALAFLLVKEIVGAIRLLQRRVDDIAKGEGDLTKRLNLARQDEFGRLASSLDDFIGKIHRLVQEVAESSGHIATATQGLSSSVQRTSEGVENQRMQTDQMATAVNEMDATAREVAANVEEASQRAGEANRETAAVQSVVRQTAETVTRLAGQITESAQVIGSLNNSVNNINSVLAVIQGIAEQTNLLALNAAIEAARAGEQGRGFAVVADEVRSLAAKTQGSTEEIRSMIERLKAEANRAVSVMTASRAVSDETTEHASNAEQTLSRISELIQSLSDMNRQIAAAAEEQSATTSSVNESITEVQRIAQSTSERMVATLGTANELSAIGATLKSQVSQFRV